MSFLKNINDKINDKTEEYYKNIKDVLDNDFKNKVIFKTFLKPNMGAFSINQLGVELTIPVVEKDIIIFHIFKVFNWSSKEEFVIEKNIKNFPTIQKIEKEYCETIALFNSLGLAFSEMINLVDKENMSIDIIDIGCDCNNLNDIYSKCLNDLILNDELWIGKVRTMQSGIENIIDIKISKKSIENFKNLDLTNLIEKSPIDCQKAIIDLLINSKKTAKIKRNKI